jgi:hypothetical protein
MENIIPRDENLDADTAAAYITVTQLNKKGLIPCEDDGKIHLLEGAEEIPEENLRLLLCEIQCGCSNSINVFRDPKTMFYFVDSSMAADVFGTLGGSYTKESPDGLEQMDWCLEED